MSAASFSSFPESVEEAGALLGATITRCDKQTVNLTPPPKGMHSSFSTMQPVPSSELMTRLHELRALLRSAPQNEPLSAAPSLLAVLMKLLGVSTTLAAASISAVSSSADETPPMQSTPLRMLWVDCVVLCHRLGEGLSGSAKIHTTNFMRKMLALAGTNPRSVKASGGVRIAALDVITGLLEDTQLSSQLAPWSLEVIQVCLRALRSAGNGEPTYRVASVRTACATAVACRQASLKTRPREGKDALAMQGAMDDKTIAEAVKLLRQAVTDKFPEVRHTAATFAALLAPLLLQSSPQLDHGSFLDDVMNTALKNIDDESPFVADGWADALSRCMSTAIQFNEQAKAGGGRGEGSGDTAAAKSSVGEFDPMSSVRLGGSRKNAGWLHACSSLKNAVAVMVDVFVKGGGELTASRAGGTFSTGGRAVRVGMCLVLTKLLRLQSELGSVGEGRSMTMQETITGILEMVGEEMEKQLKPPTGPESTGAANNLFGTVRNWCRADPVIARWATCRVLRKGLSEVAAEPVQLAILQELVESMPTSGPSNTTSESSSSSPARALNLHQLQVVLIEISHLLATLGEAAASKVESLVPKLKGCLGHSDHGVRHEGAIACVALSRSFTSEGQKLLRAAVDEIQFHHAQLVTLASTREPKQDDQTSALRMFRRAAPKEKPVDHSRPHQFAVHGRALMVSMLLRDLPHLPCDLLRMAMSVAEILVSCQFNDVMTRGNAGAACACVRSGFGIMAGALGTGPKGVAPHIGLVFGSWQKASKSAQTGGKHLASRHDLYCLDGVLSSIVVFLKYCSELLLTLPQALSQVTVLLEEILPLFLPQGRIGSTPVTPPVTARLECARASLLEAFAWLPSGSFPMVADTVFSFAAQHIEAAVENEVSCSILHSLVTKEDSILDSKTLCRAKRDGQVGGARDLEETIIALTSEVALQGEREAVLHLLEDLPVSWLDEDSASFHGSRILGMFASDCTDEKPPTPLHEVGTWRRPIDPSCSSKVRLVDAAIQAFSATFGLKSGKEQQHAMDMLESLVPPLLAQLARAIGVNNAALNEKDRRSKAKEDNAAVANITAVLLSCLQALPLHEATHNVPVGLGPPWMNKAKDLLLTVLPSASNVARRAAAEGLALLATLGVSEDAHFLQSTVLHSLDEVMQGNKPDGKPRTIALEPVSAARAGSLLTLACIQRTTYNVAERQKARARARVISSSEEEPRAKIPENELPVLQMMTRILPSTSCRGLVDYFVVRTYALHSFAVLLAYSGRLDKATLADDSKQLLRKGIELVEDNFVSSWAAASMDIDRGEEAEKMAAEVSFLATLLRLMTFLVPSLHHLCSEIPDTGRRFSLMATLTLENHGSHPVVATEAMAFFEALTAHQQVLPSPQKRIEYTENALFSCIPFILDCITPDRPTKFAKVSWHQGCFASPVSLRAAVFAIKVLSLHQISVTEWTDMKVVSLLVALLEAVCGARYFFGADMLRSVAAPRESELLFSSAIALERELFRIVPILLLLERSVQNFLKERFVRWILFARALLTSVGSSPADSETEFSRSGVIEAAITVSISDTLPVYETASPVRWQVKTLVAQLATAAFDEAARIRRRSSENDDPHFNMTTATRLCAQQCRTAHQAGGRLPCSLAVFHLEGILSATCVTATSTQDQAELSTLQESSMHLLVNLVTCFGRSPDPEQPETSILDQYSTQIFSSIKHALGAPGESDSEASRRLFLVGCDALQAVVETELAKDQMVLKRLLRPAVPTAEETPFFKCDDGYPPAPLGDQHNSLLVNIGKFWVTGKLLLSSLPGGSNRTIAAVTKELLPDEAAVAAHAAAVALDGARLLLGYNLSLVGVPLSKEDKRRGAISCERGLLYTDLSDINSTVKAALVKAWASCASTALRPLMQAARLEDSSQERRDVCISWIHVLVPLLFAGVRDAQDHKRSVSLSREERLDSNWARGLFPSEIEVDCLRGIVLLVSSANDSIFDSQWNADLQALMDNLRESVLLTCLESSGSSSEAASGRPEPIVVVEACNLIRALAAAKSNALSDEDTALLVTVLAPLNLLENKKLQFDDELVEEVVCTCLFAAASLTTRRTSSVALVKAMLNLVLNSVLCTGGEAYPNRVKAASKQLLLDCLKHDSVDASRRSQVALSLANAGNWDAWTEVAAIDDGVAAYKSVGILQNLLGPSGKATSQVAALGAIREMVQNVIVPSPFVGFLLHGAGAEVFGVLQNYGTAQIARAAHEHRKTVCADSMKVLLIGYQQVSSQGPDDNIASFLFVFFEVLLAVIRFNGLPNYPSPSVEGDAALGRMSAQAILHCARTTPVSFKQTVATLAEPDRVLLEFTVRAEMSGYAVAEQTPAKKKLNLKGFKK